jgi:hypothetical protein
MNANKTATATFTAIPTYTLTVTPSPSTGGSIAKGPDQPSYLSGTVVTLTATPAVGYVFSSWSGGLTGNANPATITMNGNKTVSAIFTAVPTYTLTPSAGTRGTITRSTPPRHSSAAKSQDVTLVFVKP